MAKQILIGKGGKLGQGPGSRQGRSMREVLLEVRTRQPLIRVCGTDLVGIVFTGNREEIKGRQILRPWIG